MMRFFIFILAFFVPFNVWAVSSDFSVRFLIGDDVTPPTTPNLISILPVSYSQIDVNWSVATDNFSSVSYVLYRDGTAIATTTLTNYNDLGLTPNTLYSYEVVAFDSSYNFSTTSNSLSTTTLPLPPTPPPIVLDDNDSDESTRTLVLKDFQLNTTENSANFSWETSMPSNYSLRWGKSTEYDMGYVNSQLFSRKQKTQITELEPNTKYFYELIGSNSSGVNRVLKVGNFKTNVVVQKFTPPNVSRLFGVFDGENGAVLSWQLPTAINIKAVRVVSNHYDFPKDINDGKVVYEGLASEISDLEAFKDFDYNYYSVFVIDSENNISSGAVVRVNKEIYLDPKDNDYKDDKDFSTTTTENILEGEEFGLKDLDLKNIYIYQGDIFFDFSNQKIELSHIKPFTISIPKKALPEHLKSIIITLLDPTNHHRKYSFLLKINSDETAYEATIAPLKVLGASKLQIEIYDFNKGLKGLYRKQIDFVVESNDEIKETVIEKMFKSIENNFSFLLIIFLITLLMTFYYRYKLRIISND